MRWCIVVIVCTLVYNIRGERIRHGWLGVVFFLTCLRRIERDRTSYDQ